MERTKVYQLCTLNRCMGINSLIPDRFVYTDYQEAENHAIGLIKTFADRGELMQFKGSISNLGDIRDLYAKRDEEDKNEVYIYEITVK